MMIFFGLTGEVDFVFFSFKILIFNYLNIVHHSHEMVSCSF